MYLVTTHLQQSHSATRHVPLSAIKSTFDLKIEIGAISQKIFNKNLGQLQKLTLGALAYPQAFTVQSALKAIFDYEM